jgi:hypothetical protein
MQAYGVAKLVWLPVQAGAPGGATQRIQDNTETNLINLRRTIYLTIMSALDFEEAGHKLMKISLAPGQETEICTMIIECCSQEKSYSKCGCASFLLLCTRAYTAYMRHPRLLACKKKELP